MLMLWCKKIWYEDVRSMYTMRAQWHDRAWHERVSYGFLEMGYETTEHATLELLFFLSSAGYVLEKSSERSYSKET